MTIKYKCFRRGCENETDYKYCMSCLVELSRKSVTKKNKKEENERKKKYKENTKTYTQKVNEVKKVFQAWIRNRDEKLPCISCGTTCGICL